MMSNVTQYFQQAELALAAYSNLNSDMPLEAYKTALQQGGVGMSQSQAEQFATRFKVVDQFISFGVIGTGFSATVFEAVSGPDAGKRYLAIRGTESSSLLDFIADADLALFNGVAALQAVDLYNQTKGTGVDFFLSH